MVEACVDGSFCLACVDNTIMLKRTHDYYYQVTGQLALTGAQFCDFVIWTEVDMHVERIYLDSELWEDIVKKLTHFYNTCLGLEILVICNNLCCRLLNIRCTFTHISILSVINLLY